MNRVAVTGAGGFIGSALVERLAQMSIATHALLGPPDAPVTRPPPGVRTFTGYIERPEDVTPVVDSCDVVVHLAGPASVAMSFDAPAEFARAHVCGTVNVLEACRRAGVRRLVYVSSAEVYGRPRSTPVDESHPLEARSPYAAAKLGAERMIEAYRLTNAIEAVSLRPFSVYGPRQSAGGVVRAVLEQALHADTIELADATPVRDFCFVEDLVDALLAAATRPLMQHPAYNIGSGVPTSIGELASTAAHIVGRTIPIRQRRSDRPATAVISQLVADIRRAKLELAWTPRTSLANGLRATVNWYGRQLEGT